MSVIELSVQFLGPHYAKVKFFHLLFAMIWLWSTAVAYINYVVPVLLHWFNDPDDPELLRKRNEVLERFDQGVALEHIAFPLLLISGLTLLLIGGWGAHNYWLVIKLSIVILIFLPLEIFDYWLSHFGGNKKKARLHEGCDALQSARYEQLTQTHLWFLTITTPLIATGGVFVVYLATVKPA